MSNPLSPDPNQNLLPSASFSALNWEPQEPNPAVILQSDLLIGHINQNPNIPALTPNPSDSLLLAQIEGSIATIDPNITLPNDNSFDGLTGEAMDIVKEQLTQFAKVPNFVEKMNLAFGESWDNQAANVLTQDWLNGDFSLIPPVKFVSSAEIGGANGAFAAATDTIYLSRELLAENGANPATVADVLLEEIGHSVDARLNVADSPGDEGAIFGAVVQGKTLEPQELLKLKAKDDSGTAIISGINLPVEQSRIKKQRDFNGDNISDLLRQEKGSWINNSRDAEVYLSNGSWGFKQQNVLPDGYWMNGDLANFIYGDFNGDYKTDFIRQEKGSWVDGGNDVQIFISKGDGTFLNPVNMNEMSSMNGNNVNLIVGDFNGNGTDDIIRQEKGNWVNGVNDTQFYTYSNGNFVKVKDVPDMAAMNGNYTNLIAGDFDGNGITDLLRQEKGSWINNTRDAEVYLSDGSWGFKTQSVLPGGSWMNGDLVNFIPGYFNADNKTDLIRQEKGGWVDGGNDVQILISKGDGTFQNPVNMNDMGMMNGNVANLIVGDFTGGGFDDIIRQSKNSGDAQFYTFSAGNFRKVGNVPDMAAMNGSGVNLAPKIDGASSYPYAAPPGGIVTPPPGYYRELSSLSETQWDQQSGDNNQFEQYPLGGGGDQRGKTDDRIEQIYTDLSNSIFGYRARMNAGYAYDQSYLSLGVGYHSGLDINAANGIDTVKAAVNGVVAIVPYPEYIDTDRNGTKETFNGWWIAIDEVDSSGNEVGRRWWYGHMKQPTPTTNLSLGTRVYGGQTPLAKADFAHLHLGVKNVSNGGIVNGSSVADVQSRTISPLHAYWKARNNIKESTIWTL